MVRAGALFRTQSLTADPSVCDDNAARFRLCRSGGKKAPKGCAGLDRTIGPATTIAASARKPLPMRTERVTREYGAAAAAGTRSPSKLESLGEHLDPATTNSRRRGRSECDWEML